MDEPLSPGDVIAGKYRVERVLGKGGMGAKTLAALSALIIGLPVCLVGVCYWASRPPKVRGGSKPQPPPEIEGGP